MEKKYINKKPAILTPLPNLTSIIMDEPENVVAETVAESAPEEAAPAEAAAE